VPAKAELEVDGEEGEGMGLLRSENIAWISCAVKLWTMLGSQVYLLQERENMTFHIFTIIVEKRIHILKLLESETIAY